MNFAHPLIKGTLLRRYKRFLADVELESGRVITAHTANTGAMTGCAEPGSVVWLSQSSNPGRKYAYSWEIVESSTCSGKVAIGINTMMSNRLVKEAIENGVITELQNYNKISTEVKYGEENSRIDLLLSRVDIADDTHASCYVEVKNVTLVENNIAYFPDAVSKRGTKHLRELMAMSAQGYRAVIFFCIQRTDVDEFRPADHIDKNYGYYLREARSNGVEVLAYLASVTRKTIQIDRKVPVFLS